MLIPNQRMLIAGMNLLQIYPLAIRITLTPGDIGKIAITWCFQSTQIDAVYSHDSLFTRLRWGGRNTFLRPFCFPGHFFCHLLATADSWHSEHWAASVQFLGSWIISGLSRLLSSSWVALKTISGSHFFTYNHFFSVSHNNYPLAKNLASGQKIGHTRKHMATQRWCSFLCVVHRLQFVPPSRHQASTSPSTQATWCVHTT